ncbi:MAG: DUF4389 domain-containing protein [Chloroflexota bacterium]|nr:DUF4389 domain-containing protein [Chloroflexota bacterium]
MAVYPATFDVDRPSSYDRTQVVIRILIIVVLSILAGALGWVHGVLYLAVPVLAAILISQKGAQVYLAESGDTMQRWLAYLFAFYAYLGLLTDTLPGDDPQRAIRFHVATAGEPTAGNVLLRIILAIPHAIVLGLLGIVAAVLIVIAAVMVLVNESYPEGIFDFLRGYLRWQVRMYAYLAGLVQEYPPFALDTGSEAAPSSAPQAGDAPPPGSTV